MENEIDKIKYHIRMLAEVIDSKEHPIPSLVVSLNWDEKDLDRAEDIFGKYDALLNEGKNPSWQELEIDLKAEFGIGYKGVKEVVNAFYRNSQWPDVCFWFAKGQEPTCPMELKHIIQDH